MKRMMQALLLVGISYSLFSHAIPSINPQELMATLSLREKIAQLCIVATISHEEKNKEFMRGWVEWCKGDLSTAHIKQLITDYGIGGIIFFGHESDAADQAALTDELQALSKIPLMVALDAEYGLSQRLKDGLCFPRNMTIAATGNMGWAYQIGKEIGEQLKKIGVHINFAPVVDVNNNPGNPIIGNRSFGSNVHTVSQLGLAYMQGMQDAGVMACAKHFPGHGDTAVDSHRGLPYIPHSRAHLEEIELPPFKKLFEAGVRSVMLAHLEVPALEQTPGIPSSLSYAIATELLQQQMGFNGLIITDSLGMWGVSLHAQPGELEVKVLLAGADMLLCPTDTVKAIDAIEKAVHDGILTEEAINQKVLKVLKAKEWAFAQAIRTPKNLEEALHSPEAKKLKKKVYSHAITVAKSSAQSIHIPTTRTAALIDITDKPSTFENILKERCSLPSFTLTTQPTPHDINQIEEQVRDIPHIIIGVHHINRFGSNAQEYAQVITEHIQTLKGDNKEVTVVLFCSPYNIPTFKDADTIIVAYEDDPDAQEAAAEVVLGTRKAKGKLPVEIPDLEQ